MKVLLYIRPKAEEFYRNVASGVFHNPEVITYSDYNGIADVWAGKYIYSEKYDIYNKKFEELAPDILPRCRTLRKMSAELAHKLANRYWNGMVEFFSENQFDYLITMPVDCYTLDIICRVAELYGVKVISFLGAPFAGHAKVTVRGEYTKVRDDVPNDEIEHFIQLMTKDEYLTPSEIKNVQKNHKSIYKFFYRRFLIEYFYYPLKKLIEHDPWNYHYNIFEVKGKQFSDVYNNNFEKYFKHITDLNIDKKTTVYYPMHFVPEATTDYWCSDVKVANYNQFVIDMISNADPGIKFIIKEHPAMYGRRNLEFYDQLNSVDNVILLHAMDRSNNLLRDVDNVLVDNGTVGIEALMRGKRVLCMSDNYYRRFHPNAILVDRVTKDALNSPLKSFDNYEFMKCLLQGTFISDFRNSTNGIPASNPEQVIKGITEYLIINGWRV